MNKLAKLMLQSRSHAAHAHNEALMAHSEASEAVVAHYGSVNWFCPNCRQWFQTLQKPEETRIGSKVRIRSEHWALGCCSHP